MLYPQESVPEANLAPALCDVPPDPDPAFCEVPPNLALAASGWGLSQPGSEELAGRSQTEI
jgi:hypothetical protein